MYLDDNVNGRMFSDWMLLNNYSENIANTNQKNIKMALQNRLFFPFTSEGEQTPIEGCNQSKNFYIKGGYFSPISEEISRGIFHLDFSEKFWLFLSKAISVFPLP